MATLPASAVGEVRLTLRLQNGDGTDAPAEGYAWLYPNLRPGTTYRASNVDAQVAAKTKLVFDGSGNLEDPETDLFPKVLASDAPGASFPGMQWVLEFHLSNVQAQPATKYFTVPAGSFVNVGLLADTTTPQPAVQTVYVDSAPLLTALNTTDSAVANLVNTSSSTRTALDGRYARITTEVVADLTALAALTGMVTGALVSVTEGGAIFRYNGTAWVQQTPATFATTTARDSAYNKASAAYRVAGAQVVRSDTKWTEEYQPVDTSITPNRPAGWHILFGAGAPAFRVTSGSTQALTNTEQTLTNWGTPSVNRGFTSFAAGVLTVAQPGWYEVTFSYQINATIANSAVIAAGGTSYYMDSTSGSNARTQIVPLVAGDTITPRVFSSAAATANNSRQQLMARYIGPL